MAEEDKYEVLEKIGHGSFGVIRKVRRISDGLVLCRKEISYLKMSQKEREQLQAELSILKELRHANIVAYYSRSHIKATQDLHLYMEYCGNGDLGMLIQDLKKKGQYAEEEFVWSVFAQLVTALYRCHYGEDPPPVGKRFMEPERLQTKQGRFMILHRDLKPENVFLGEDNSVKLGDFGLSKILPSTALASTYVGTPFYMSPEICAAEHYTLYSDIWSLGCIIYEMCAKEPPFNAKTHWDLIQKIKAGRVAPLPSCYSPELQKVVTSCLKVRPNERPSTKDLLGLPVVRLMRKEQEVVQIGRELRSEREMVEKMRKELQEKTSTLEQEKERMRNDIDNALRREWEVKAQLEIKRLTDIELNRLKKIFDVEVGRQVDLEVDRRISDISLHSDSEPTEVFGRQRSSTPTNDQEGYSRAQASFSTLNEESDSEDITDLTELSMESPNPRPLKRSARTPFARAHTLAVPANMIASPMDVQMGEPSPMSNSLAGLSLSPRRNGSGHHQLDQPPISKLGRNIFEAPEKRWEPLNAEDLSSSPIGEADADALDDDDLAELSKPSSKEDNDPFKAANGHRPALSRARTTGVTQLHPTRLTAATGMAIPANPSSAALARGRPSGVGAAAGSSPVSRRGIPSPVRRAPKAPGVNDNGSPLKQRNASGLKSKKGNEDMLRNALKNQYSNIQGRTLVELAQARAGAGGGTSVKDFGTAGLDEKKAVKVRTDEVPVWDPERDEMPSPFLARGQRMKLSR